MKKEELKIGEGLRLFPGFPVAMVTSGSGKNRNIITAAMVHIFSFDPPLIGVGVSPKRHSHKLMSEGDDFVINIPGKDLVREALLCGTCSGRDVKKFEVAGLTPVNSETVEPPGIDECLVIIECKKRQTVTTGDHDWFIGEPTRIIAEKTYARSKGLIYWGGDFRLPGKVIKER